MELLAIRLRPAKNAGQVAGYRYASSMFKEQQILQELRLNDQTSMVIKRKLPHERGTYHYSLFLPLLVLLITLLVTYEAWKGARQDADETLMAQFIFSAREIVDDVEKRMKPYEQIMRGVDGLYAHASIVTREDSR